MSTTCVHAVASRGCCAALLTCPPLAANYLEIADLDTVTTGAGLSTAKAFTDGITLADGTFVPLNQVRLWCP